MPGTKDITLSILNKRLLGLTSMVMCFEDSIREDQLSLG
ncbi:HpcH/HpaI aldolase/citrate lyase family protein [Mesotoga sp.]